MVNSFTDSVELTQAWAEQQDLIDPLSSFRSEFHIPSITDITRPTLAKPPNEPASQPSIYLCGNSLGVQPRRTAAVIDTFLAQWRTKGVKGHFLEHQDSSLAPFLHVDDAAAKLMAPIVGALTSEVAVMGTLTANLHALLCSFYKPTKTGERRRWKIMLEGKAFPSDHFAVESQIQHWGLDPAEAMILLEPEDADVPILKTEDILRRIDEHSEELAVLLLPGIQFYTGQLFDMKTITAYAQSKGVIVGWDCAHAAGNVELKLHEWNVDFAAWCTYKYLNAGPGAMAGIFVHERYGRIEPDTGDYWPRLTGWWGDDKSGRFAMTNKFAPRPGAAGFQLSNPSALDLASVVASLQIFNETTMSALRERSLRLTGFLERLLEQLHGDQPDAFTIITPRDPESRGSQLSLRLRPHTLEKVLASLEEHGVVVDERRPDVIRVAPAPLYNTFADVWHFCRIFDMALQNSK